MDKQRKIQTELKEAEIEGEEKTESILAEGPLCYSF